MGDLIMQLLETPEERLRRICAANDRNGDFEECTRDELVCMILDWAFMDNNPEGDLWFLLRLA